MENKFSTGKLFTSFSIATELKSNEPFTIFVQDCINKHKKCDWGDLEPEDLESNNEALETQGRLLSSYKIPKEFNITAGEKIWIITEYDRSATTILFPTEY